MKRIMIIGFSGCGKSTLAQELGRILNITPMHMDALHWLPGWVESSREHKIKLLAPVLERDSWIIDGSYTKVLYKERAEKSDTIIFLDFNRFLCLYRVLKRRIIFHGKTRSDMGEGCVEKIDLGFLKWVIWDGRKGRKGKYEFIRAYENDKNVLVFRRPKDLEKFLKNFSERNGR